MSLWRVTLRIEFVSVGDGLVKLLTTNYSSNTAMYIAQKGRGEGVG